MRVTDPSGLEWAVRVEWAPRHRALFLRFGAWRRGTSKKNSSRWDWVPDFPVLGDDPISAVIGLVFVLIFLVVLIWLLVVPLLFLLIDAVIVLALLLLGLAVRVVFRRPWTVLATAGPHTHELQVTGWKRALRTRDGIAAGLQTGGAAAWPSLALRRWET